jgi:hypothetical protein
MKFEITGPFKENIYNLMRKAGYSFQRKNQAKSELVFVRPPSGFPRFHIYLKENDDKLVFDLHLDQKKQIYKGATAHSGEYDNQTINQEKQRLEAFFDQL